jgi:hypothetical protein
MNDLGEINGWICRVCTLPTYVVHVDHGVTPMFLACRATGNLEDCRGTAVSMMYPPPPYPDHVKSAVNFEWYKPDEREYRKLELDSIDHVDKGGLLLRPLTDEGRKVLDGPSTTSS